MQGYTVRSACDVDEKVHDRPIVIPVTTSAVRLDIILSHLL